MTGPHVVPFPSPGVAPAALFAWGDGRVWFGKRADPDAIQRERRAVAEAHRHGIGHLVLPCVGWHDRAHDADATHWLLTPYLADAVMLSRHPHGAARLRALAAWEKLALLRWQQATGDVDRHAENLLVRPGGQIVAIDHGAAYRADTTPGGALPTRPEQNAVWHRAWVGGERAAGRAWAARSPCATGYVSGASEGT